MPIVFRRLRHLSVALLLLTASVTFAQTTLGELLDAGGKQLSKEEALAVVSGNTIVGPTLSGAINTVKYNADGSYTGSGSSAGNTYGFFGTWTVDADGQFCGISGGGANRGAKSCGYWFKASEQYFGCISNSDRNAPVIKRTRQP